MTRLYGVFSPRGELVAAFSSHKAADAMAQYNAELSRQLKGLTLIERR